MWLSTLLIRAAQLRSVTEIAPKSPFLCVNRSPIRYGFCAGAKAIRYSVNTFRICGSPLYWSTQRSFAPLQKSHRNHRSYVWTEALSGMVFVPVQKPSGIVWTPFGYVTLRLYWSAQRNIAPLPFLWVNRNPIRYGFRAGARAIRCSVNKA